MDRTRTLTRIAMFAALLAASAYIRIPAGPVPLTLQSAVAVLAGYCLGPRRGAAACLLYTAVGLAGAPVFAAGGGPTYILSPTFGYILGFAPGAFITGLLAGRTGKRSVPAAWTVMAAGLAGIYVPGLAWLTVVLGLMGDFPGGVTAIVRMGLLIPLPGDLVTLVPAALAGLRLGPLMRKT